MNHQFNKLLLICIISFCNFELHAQASKFLKNALREEQQVAKTILKNEAEALAKNSAHIADEAIIPLSSGIAISKRIEGSYLKNLKKFYKDYEKVIDFAKEVLENIIENEIEENESKRVRLAEIHSHNSYPQLYTAICKKLNKQEVTDIEVNALLLGYKVEGKAIDSNKLFKVYFIYSNSFAQEVLHNMLQDYNCSEEERETIITYATQRNIKIEDECALSERENFIISILTGIIFLGIFALILYIVYSYVRGIFKKARG